MIVKVDCVGDAVKIGVGVICMIINLCELFIVCSAVDVIVNFGYFKEGFFM